MTTNDCQFQSMIPGSLAGVQAKVLEAVSAFAQASERVVGGLIELSSVAARESLRTAVELQAAAMDMARTVPAPSLPKSDAVEELRRDPLAWYRMGFEALADSTKRAARLVETNTQIVTRNTERMQGSAERVAKEIEQAASGYVSRMKDIYTR